MPNITTAFAQGTHSARPTADPVTNNGYYYYETDTTTLFQNWNGSWVQIGLAGNGFDASKITSGNIATARLGNVNMLLPQANTWNSGHSAITKAFMATTGGTVFTDVTTNLNGAGGATLNYGAVNDALYIGSTSTAAGQFYGWSVVRQTAAVWSLTLVFEYWSGSAWTAFPAGNNYFDGTTAFTASGTTSNFLPPSDWATTTVNAVAAWWIRVRCSAFTSTATSPVYKTGQLYRWSDAGATNANGLVPTHGSITTYVPGNWVSTNAYAYYNFTTNTYTALSTNPTPTTITGLSLPVSAGDAWGVFRFIGTGSSLPDGGTATLTLS